MNKGLNEMGTPWKGVKREALNRLACCCGELLVVVVILGPFNGLWNTILQSVSCVKCKLI